MKDQSNKELKNINSNVEFGFEFGDMNAAKLIEYPFMNQDKKKNSTKNKNGKPAH